MGVMICLGYGGLRSPSALSSINANTGIYHTIIRVAFACLSVCLFVPLLLRGHLTDLHQTWWVYVGGPRNCP